MSKPRMGASRRVGIGLLASALFVFGIALAPNAGATADVEVIRYAGTDRYGTAQDIATDPAFDGATTAIVATGEKFPDALAASSIAGVNAPAPILLTQSNVYRDETSDALADLGVDDVIIVGGTAAVSSSVEDAIEGEGYTVSRLAGTDRYGTAADIASEVGTAPDVDGLATAFVAAADPTATGDDNFVDALAGGVATYAGGFPLVLVTVGDVPAVTESALEDLGVEQVVILGGTVRVPASVEEELEDITGNDAVRAAGATRFETAIEVAEWEEAELGFTPDAVVAATGFKFPDALAGGPLGGEHEAPIVLTSSCPEATTDYLEENSDTIATIYITGGTAVIDDATEDCLEAAAEGGAAAGVTSRPELTSASVIGTVTSGINAGTTVRYVFDDPVQINAASNPPTAGLFYAVSSNSTRYTGDSIAAVSGNANAADVLFTDAALQTTSGAAGLTVATNDVNAIFDTTGEGAPEGDAALGAQTGTALPAGTTSAPDVTSVGNFTAATSTQTFVDFTFDEAAWVLTNTGFNIIETDNNPVNCTYDHGTGTTTLTVVCLNSAVHASSTTQITASEIARGSVNEDAVSDLQTGGNTNPMQIAEVSNNGQTGTAPDLESATFNQDATVGGTAVDQVTYVFDQAVATGGGGNTTFNVYLANGQDNEDAGAAVTSVATASTSPNSVLVTFPNGALASAVGASVDDNAVVAAGGAAPGTANQEDEVGVANTTSGTTSGLTTGPDLTLVTKKAGTDIFGNPTGGSDIVYTFDEDLASFTLTDFFAYLADGTRLIASSCSIGSTEDVDNTLTCIAYTVSGTAASNTIENAIVLGTTDDTSVVSQAADGGDANNAEGAHKV